MLRYAIPCLLLLTTLSAVPATSAPTCLLADCVTTPGVDIQDVLMDGEYPDAFALRMADAPLTPTAYEASYCIDDGTSGLRCFRVTAAWDGSALTAGLQAKVRGGYCDLAPPVVTVDPPSRYGHVLRWTLQKDAHGLYHAPNGDCSQLRFADRVITPWQDTLTCLTAEAYAHPRAPLFADATGVARIGGMLWGTSSAAICGICDPIQAMQGEVADQRRSAQDALS